jgi:hypothetical protein
MIAELLIAGFFTAIGWWGANHYVIEPYFPAELKQTEKKDEKST